MSLKLTLTLAAMLAALVGTDARALNVQGAVPPDPNTLLRSVVRENGGEGGIARWTEPAVCPAVSGLPRDEGEFVLERLSEIARTAGVPLAGESCKPNLFIFVTADPKALLKRMEKRDYAYLFSCARYPGDGASPARVNEFIDTPRVVRRWYNTMVIDNGSSMCADRYHHNVPFANASHLENSIQWSFYSVFVVVDQTGIKGVTRGQLADYIGVVSLANVQSADVRNPTILKLFDGAPQAAPSGLTDYDQALLKAVYAADPRSKL